MPSTLRSRAVSPISIHTPSPTANDFPIPAGQVFNVTKRDQGLVSPSQSSFSFQDTDSPHAISTPQSMTEENGIFRHEDRGAPGDGAIIAATKGTPQQQELRKKKSNFYTEVFSYREPNLSPKERIYKDSVVTAEVKTNVIIKDEFDFLQDISQHLAQRYQRPTSSIFISLNHSACLQYGGSFDSAYMLTISALPSQLLPTTNKRNAALLQSFLADSLGVVPARGVIRFAPIAEQDLAFNGTTVLGQIENLQKIAGKEQPPAPTLSAFPQKTKSKRQTSIQTQTKPHELPARQVPHSLPISRVTSPTFQSPILPAIPTEKSTMDLRAEKAQKLGKRRSFLAMFGRGKMYDDTAMRR